MTIVDDRNDTEKTTHIWGVVAKDVFMSGWGGAAGGASRVAWAVDHPTKTNKLFEWVKNRNDMKYASIVRLDGYRAPKGTAHFHIYVPKDGHPGFGS